MKFSLKAGGIPYTELRFIRKKFLEFKMMGLVSYGKYLEAELIKASKSPSWKYYKKYILDQIELNTKKIKKMNKKY